MDEVEGKVCTGCQQMLPFTAFSKNKAKKDGLDNKCRECTKKKNQEQYAKHAEKRRAYANQYAEEHKEQKSEYNKEYRAKNAERLNIYVKEWRVRTGYVKPPEARERDLVGRRERYRNDPVYRAEIIARTKAWREKNKDWVRIYGSQYNQAYRERNREALNERHRQQYEENPEPFKQSWRAYVQKNKIKVMAKKKEWGAANPERAIASGHRYRANNRDRIAARHERRQQIIAESGNHFTRDDFARKMVYSDGCCFYCNAPMNTERTGKAGEMGRDRSVDHIIPLARGGDNSSRNTILCCFSCNASKGKRLLHEEWEPQSIEAAPETRYRHIHGQLQAIASWADSLGVRSQFPATDVLEFPDNDILISAASLFWDSERYKAKPIRLTVGTIHLYEDELEQNMPAIQNTLLHAFGQSPATYGRKTVIDSDVLYSEAMDFLSANHLNGKTPVNTLRYGLRKPDGTLVALATFGKNGLVRGLSEGEWELSRLAFSGSVPGGASKLMAAFKADHKPTRIMTYTDPSKLRGGIYAELGFRQENSPSEFSVYVQDFDRVGERAIRNQVLANTLMHVKSDISVWRNARMNGVYRIHYPGVARFVWTPETVA